MIAYLFVALAAILNAFMDKVENEHFHSSIFKKWNQKFWYKRESWKYAKMIGGYRLDAWHLAKSLMIICFAFAIGFMDMTHWWAVKFVTVGGIWIVVFNLFYNKLFKSNETTKEG